MFQDGMATKRSKKHKGIFWSSLCLLVANAPLFASDPLDIGLLNQGRVVFPRVWNAYRPASLPPVDPNNGPNVSSRIQQGKLALSLNEFLQLVVENNLTLQAARYNYMIAQVDLLRAKSGQAARGVPSVPVPGALFSGAIGAGLGTTSGLINGGTGGTAISANAKALVLGPRGAFDPTISINMSWDRVVNPLNTVKVAGTPIVATPSAVLQTRWQQQLPFGTSYSISFNMQRQTTTQAHILYNPAFTSFFSLTVYHPLMNGAGRAFTRRFVNLAENDRQIASEGFHTDMDNALSDAANTYWDYVALRERQRVAEQELGFAETIYRSTEQRIQIGILSPTDLITAESQVAATRRDLIIAQTNAQLQEVRLKSLITKVIDADISAAPFEPADTLAGTVQTSIPPLEDALTTAMRRPSIHQADLGLENQRIAQEFTRSNLKPTFSAFLQVNGYSLAPGMNEMFRQTFAYTYPEVGFGFSLSFAVKNRAAQADDVRARLELQQAQVAFEQTKANVGLQVRTALTSITQNRSQVEAAQRAVAASQQTAEAEQEKWMAGFSTLDNVYQRQVDLAQAQAAEIQSRVNYAKSIIAEELAVGSLLESHDIVFDDALRGNLWKGSAKP
jgi:outer membrane protein TolC